MRVGLMIYGSLETISGGYLYDRMVVQYLRAQGHTVEVVSLPWRSYGAHLLDNLDNDLLRRLVQLPVDLLIQDELNHPSLAWLNARLRRQRNLPLISLVHHLRSSEAHPPPARLLYRLVERRYLRSVDGFIFNSRTTCDSVQAFLTRPYPGLVAYPAADHRAPAGPPTWPHEAAESLLRLLFIGNLIPRKGLHTVLEALTVDPALPIHLDVVGSAQADPAYARRIRSRIARQGLGRRVTLHDSLSDARLQERLAATDLLVVPSYEGFGIVYLEAMAHGKPVIASTAGAAWELVSDGENGFLVPPNDAATLAQRLRLLADNRTRLAEMGAAARRRYVMHPTWQMTAASICHWLHENYR